MKRAYQSAVQNAFSHLLLVVLDNGKVFVDVNMTITDAEANMPTDAAAVYHSDILPVGTYTFFVIFTCSVAVLIVGLKSC